MTQTNVNVETVRVAYEIAYARRSVEDVRDRFAEDFVWHSRQEFPGRSTYKIDEMPQLWADLDETYSDFELVPVEFEEAGDYVIVTMRQSARLRGSENRIKSTMWHVWRVEDGVPREAWAYGELAEARARAGLAS